MGTTRNSHVRFDGSYHALGCAEVSALFLRDSSKPIQLKSASFDGELGETEDWDDFLQSLGDDLDVDGTMH